MTLKFEDLNPEIENMAHEIRRRRIRQVDELHEVIALLDKYAARGEQIKEIIDPSSLKVDLNRYRAAAPVSCHNLLNCGIKSGPPPQKATLIACDGSQILPDRHAPFLYYLINLGAIIYFHGSDQPPDTISDVSLKYPRDNGQENDPFPFGSGSISLLRDIAELEYLATAVDNQPISPDPILALLDQRLLYVPARGLPEAETNQAINKWQRQITRIRQSNALLAGFIDRPGKRSVLGMLHTINNWAEGLPINLVYETPAFPNLSDRDLFDKILKPGERSIVFEEISHHNSDFYSQDPLNSICFFFIKTGEGPGRLARIDIPISVAEDDSAVDIIHALVLDQCQILGDYPYVITRADEIAVVTRQEQEELEFRIAKRLLDLGIDADMTAKARSKTFARSIKTRHEGVH